jgi:ubiquinone/menaquinone biosynthesis C-methylase UbiE
MYEKVARYYDALYHFKDYAVAMGQLHDLIQHRVPDARSLLDVACGTGKCIEHLQAHYQTYGIDLSPEMLQVARTRCREVGFAQADMTDFDLNRTFDVVTCLFSSIGLVKTVENLDRALASMFRHLNPGGIIVVEPWFSPDNYWVDKLVANYFDESTMKIAWMYKSERQDLLSVMNIHYLVATPGGVEHFTERHEIGLFTHDQYLDAFRKTGLVVEYDSTGLFGRGMYIGINRQGGL